MLISGVPTPGRSPLGCSVRKGSSSSSCPYPRGHNSFTPACAVSIYFTLELPPSRSQAFTTAFMVLLMESQGWKT